jgi:phosphopantothenoylcysteine decarboxylase/phosphopantothenate--cysteine ligase
MLQAVLTYSRNADLLIMSAAVADFRPAQTAEQKIKKTGKELTLTLIPTTDILATVHQKRQQSGFPRHVIGFAAETEDLLNNAQKKLVSKGLDMIVANNVSALDAGFEVETNRVSFLFPDGRKVDFPLQSKYEVAERILEEALSWL